MKFKKYASAVLAALLSLSLLAGCSSGSSESSYQPEANTASADSGNTTQKKAETEAQAQAQSLSLGDIQATLNGSAPDGSYAVYTQDSFGENFSIMVVQGQLLFAYFGVIPTDKCKDGASYTYNQLDSNTAMGLFVYDFTGSEPAYYYYNTIENTDVITDASMSVKSFSSKSSAEFDLSITHTYNGKTYKFEGKAYTSYTDAAALEAASSSGNSDTCTYCSGSGRCNVCHGLGTTSWGGTTITCTSCGGAGSCYYCEGTGTQVYIVRGVRK